MKKVITIALPIIVMATFIILLFNQRKASTALNNSPDSTMNSVPDTSMYNYPTNANGSQSVATYPSTHHTTKSLSHHERYVSRSSYPAQRTTVRKKRWSGAAKGAVIGAGSGAVLGAVVAGDHNRVKGAVIGGVVGAAGGYLYGRHRDKKHRRY